MLRQSTRLGAGLAERMPLEAHRHVKSITTEIEVRLDGTVRSIAILHTDLTLSPLSPGYDANAVEQLVSRIQAFQKTHHQSVCLRTTGG